MAEEENAPLSQMLEQAVEGDAAQAVDAPAAAVAGNPVAGNPVAGSPVAGAAATEGGAEINLDALLDVPVTLSVEIGRNRLPIKELLRLNQGAVVELDREVNQPLDLLVNGTLMARGEVVVVDGQFGLRLVDIVSPSERLNGLK
ncbi:flagellar motor switch protein FliN [Pseudohalioglobus lutimaris]|uniref:Flagellar motor switch protein FliN n=1 Tax=Pseudohalioglobus lutimaris TaxID=1737061 RepID=A0A2N5X1E3_9GAMM|nr:flagellar motor switch protein FliN [Pseudohalioglobus lutimaris]PLW68303.1 flagellar motor switch protein FliN [Pseudohalioglobus lutimaris]